ncbi:hypothetical protein E27107_350019 [Elizabethkingia anophelis]|nr:hypothetical protein E27107_350019 [Elizabethkingia anophelis]
MYNILVPDSFFLIINTQACILNIAVPVILLQRIERIKKELSVQKYSFCRKNRIKNIFNLLLSDKTKNSKAFLFVNKLTGCYTMAVDRTVFITFGIDCQPAFMEFFQNTLCLLQLGFCKKVFKMNITGLIVIVMLHCGIVILNEVKVMQKSNLFQIYNNSFPFSGIEF